MSSGNLQENIDTLESLERSNKALAAKLAVAEEMKAHERSVEFLLKFEMSQVRAQINDSKKEVEDLEREQTLLVSTNQSLSLLEKHIRNYFGYVNSCQVDRKEEFLQNLRAELSALDFSIEEREVDPTRDVEAFTQYSRH